MPIELRLGDFLGTISIERKRSRSELLSNLTKDKPAIERAIRKYSKNKKLVSGGDHIGSDGFVPAKILITSFKDDWVLGPTTHKLFVDLEGYLIEEDDTVFPDGGRGGMSNMERDPYDLPEWVSEAISEEDLKAKIDKLFYPKGKK